MLRNAAAADATEDPQHGKGKRGDELPAELARRGFRRFSFRRVGRVGLEWKLVCLTGAILKLFRSGWSPEMA